MLLRQKYAQLHSAYPKQKSLKIYKLYARCEVLNQFKFEFFILLINGGEVFNIAHFAIKI